MTPQKKIAYVQAAWHTDITSRRSSPGSLEILHQDFFRAHMATKGEELASACLAIIENLAAV